MADQKYRASTVPITADQYATIAQAMELFEKREGIKITRSQMLTWLAARYIKQEGGK